MDFKKTLFSFMLAVSLVQSIHTVENRIFQLLATPTTLQDYLDTHPEAIYAISNSGESALKVALKWSSHSKTIQILLRAGANPNEYFGDSVIPTYLHYLAHRYKQRWLVKQAQNIIAQKAAYLILSGADDTIEDRYGHTPMDISPELIMDIDQIIQKQREQEKLALATLTREGRPNTGLATTMAQLLGE